MRIAVSIHALLLASLAVAQPRITAVVNGGSFQTQVAGGSFATALVAGINVPATVAPAAPLPTSLGGVTVTLDNVPVPLYYVSGSQINFQVPRNALGIVSLVVRHNNQNSAPFVFVASTTGPGVLVYGSNQAVATHPDGTLVSPSKPLSPGGVAVVYLTGIGPVDNPAPDGAPTPYPPLASATSAFSATIGGLPATVAFLGLTPGYVGLAQANMVVPDLAAGDHPVAIRVGNVTSNAPLVSVARGPGLTLRSGTVTLDPQGADSYAFEGTIQGLTLSGAQSVNFALGQFAASIPMSAFVKQAGSNALRYQDATGLAPYWLSSLILDPDARTFSARANNIALSGLPNPFALRLGTDDELGCAMARLQRTNTTTYGLITESSSDTPCLIDDVTIDPAYAGQLTSVTVAARVLSIAGLDPAGIRVYRADDSAQPAGNPLCTLAARADGTYACSFNVQEPRAGLIPLVAQAAAGSRYLLAPGFALDVMRPATAADRVQMDAVENAINAADTFFRQFGETAHARAMVITSLRKLFPGSPGLTAQPVGLTPDGLSVEVRADSGLPITLLRNRLTPFSDDFVPGVASSPAIAAARAVDRTVNTGVRLAPAPSLLSPLIGRDATEFQCGDFSRDVVKNQEFLVWDTDSLFFNVQGLDYVDYAKPLKESRCPLFTPHSISAENATPASLDEFTKYGTVVIASHGNTTRAGVGTLLTGSQDRALGESSPAIYSWDCDVTYYPRQPDGTTRESKGCFVGVKAGNPHIRQLDRTLVFGAFCYSNKLAARFINKSTSSFFGYDGTVQVNHSDDDAQGVFDRMIYSYEPTKESRGRYKLTGNKNLAYVGNPKLTAPSLGGNGPYPAASGKALTLKAELEGTDSCKQVMEHHWQNTAKGGALQAKNRPNGTDDFFARDFEADYTARSAANALSDRIMVDFIPNHEKTSQVAARACADVAPPRKEVLVTDSGVMNYSDEGPRNLLFYNPPLEVKTGNPIEIMDPTLGGTNKARIEQTATNKWTITQEFSSPTRNDIFTQTLNRVGVTVNNGPGLLAIKIHVEGSVTGTCSGIDVNLSSNGNVVRELVDGGNGCTLTKDFTMSSGSIDLRTGGLGQRGSSFGAGKGKVTTTIEMLDTRP